MHGVPGTFELRKCIACSVIFTYPQLNSEKMAAYYTTSYYMGLLERNRVASLGELSFRRRRILRRGAKRKYDLIVDHGGHGRLLDIGCSTGEFLAGMHLLGWNDLYGVELSSVASENVERSLGIKVWNAEFPDITSMAGEKFDVINLSHSFEHFSDPVCALGSLSDLLAPRGLCLITIPNPDSLDAAWFGAAWVGYEVPRHYFSFPPHVFRSLVESRGFQVVDERLTDNPHGAMLLNIAYALHGTRWAALWRRVARLLSIGVVSACFIPLYKVLEAFGNVPSMTYVLRKS